MKVISLLGSWPVVTSICLFMALFFVREWPVSPQGMDVRQMMEKTGR